MGLITTPLHCATFISQRLLQTQGAPTLQPTYMCLQQVAGVEFIV